MVLVLDVGNTNIVLGVYSEEALLKEWRLSTQITRTADEYGIKVLNLLKFSEVDPKEIVGAIISSVVPNINYSLERMIEKYFNIKPMVVGPGTKTGINIKYKNPKEVGADRIVNAVAAHEKYDRAQIIIDFGTATTYCALRRNGDYLGGAIAPGIKISADALTQRAAKLPKIELTKPSFIIGKSTESAMQAGMIYGYIGSVEYIIKGMKKELMELGEEEPLVIATGGFANLIGSSTEYIDVVDSYLTLDGLRILYHKNKE